MLLANDNIHIKSFIDLEVLEEIEKGGAISPSFYKSRKEILGITIYDLVDESDGLQFSTSIMDVKGATHVHFHPRMLEIFVGIKGKLNVCIEGKPYEVVSGSVLTIPPKSAHYLKCEEGNEARILYISLPAWSPKEVEYLDSSY